MLLPFKKYILFLFLIFIGLKICAQAIAPENVRSLTVDDGLPQGFITDILQDKQGFIWLSTMDGIARYDGRNIKVWHHDAADSNSISTNVVTGMYIDRENNIWLVHENSSIDILNAGTGIIRHISTQKQFTWLKLPEYESYNFHEDTAHEYWVISKEQLLEHFNLKNPSPVIISFPKNELPQSMYEDKAGTLWFTTNKALYISVNKNQLKKIANLPAGTNEGFLGNTFIDNNGNFVIGHATFISLYNISQHTWRQVNTPKDAPVHNKRFVITDNGRIFMNAMQNIYYLNRNYNFSLVWTNNTFPSELTAFTIDRSNVIWAGTNTFGARMINTEAGGFTSYKLPYNFFNDFLSHYWHAASVKHTDHLAIYEMRSCSDRNGVQWFINLPVIIKDSSTFPVTYIKNDTAKTIFLKKSFSGYKPEQSLTNIAIDDKGRAWVVLDYDTLTLADFKNKTLTDPVALNFTNEVPNYIIAVEDKLWIIYFDALQLFDPKTKQSVWYKDQPGVTAFRNSYMLMAVSDPKNKNILWIASRGNGLIKFDIKTGAAKIFTEKEGLPNNTVYTIVPDKDGYLWCSTNKGIFRFSPADYSVLSFTVQDGLQGNEFNRYQAINFSDGKIAFGGTQGWTLFHPDSINLDQYHPAISITNIEINNEPISRYSKWNKMLASSIDSLSLFYNQNFISFHFAGLEFKDAEKLKYRYMLTGINKNWINAGNENTANYTSLPPGSYDFKVEASNTSGVWSNKIKTLHVFIAPPWWKTWWAYVLYAATLAGMVLLFFRYRINQLRTKQEIALKKKEAEQLIAIDEMKSRFFSNITHEFRTPLSLIISPVEQMQKDEDVTPALKKKLSGVQRNAQHLLRLINQLLDMSKLEGGNMKLSLSRGEIKLFAEECVQLFKQKADAKNIDLHFDVSNADGEYLFDAEKWEKILFNLLSNAVKFTPVNGNISVNLSVTEKDNEITIMHLQVSDTGIGISEENLPFIFRRFYQADDSGTRKYEGTGIGLSLIKELTELMNGSVNVQSEKDKGTTFDIFIPVKNATDTTVPEWSKTVMPQEAVTDSIKKNLSSNNLNDKNNLPLILVVEDNAELNEFISQSLDKNYRTLTAANGSEGLRIANEQLPDIIISDVMMPVMDGYVFCKQIKSSAQTNHIAVILLTAKAAHDSVIEGLGSGADDYITKPFHVDELLLRIHNIVNRQEKLRLLFQAQLSNPNSSIHTNEIQNEFITQLYKIIDEHLDDGSLSVEKLATKAAVSHRTLNRKLSSLIGLSANELIRQYRLKRSIEFLKAGKNISETAYSVGFETHSHFTTSFKLFFGVTPTEYINSKSGN